MNLGVTFDHNLDPTGLDEVLMVLNVHLDLIGLYLSFGVVLEHFHKDTSLS